MFPTSHAVAIFKFCLTNFALAPMQASDEAIGIVNVDQEVPPEVPGELRAITAIRQARVIGIR